jgi:GST-like protein
MFQVGHVGPMLGQVHHFSNYAPEKIPYAIERFNNEAKRLYGVLDRRLDGRDYLAGEYSIADMATFPWIVPYKRHGIDWDDYPAARRWFERMKERPAVQRGLEVGKELRQPEGTQMDEETRRNLFGATQYQRR